MGIIILVLLVLSNWKPPKRDVLDGSIWKVLELNNTPLVENTTLTIQFNNRKVNGSSGCNTFSGRYEIKEESIRIYDLELKTENCLNTGIMDEERSFIKYLPDIINFKFSGQKLNLTTNNGNSVNFVSLITK